MLAWAEFLHPDFPYTDFPPGARVLDVGCGEGAQLAALRRAGIEPVGVERDPALVERLVSAGFDVRHGVAERLPVADQSFDGLVCKVVVPYTDERKAIAEWARVLRPGGRVRAVYHGAGYYLRCFVAGSGFRERAYGARAAGSTWWYVATGRRLPLPLGDTLYQSPARLARYYRACGFTLERESPSPRYGGLPAFIYHELRLSSPSPADGIAPLHPEHAGRDFGRELATRRGRG